MPRGVQIEKERELDKKNKGKKEEERERKVQCVFADFLSYIVVVIIVVA